MTRIGPLTRAEQVAAELAAIIASLPPGVPECDPLDGDMVPDDYPLDEWAMTARDNAYEKEMGLR
ncbi:hypothetical protein GCM10011584_09740 [Nocardioides phosphati]|uniref:Uncharacterized protein n=1 Tax=Nocardioides phosphati TaxID=1867775 RepID=A0ABQ2N9K5_9ACTN|nr:hypothetical protein [Nocardioides phosphati]GGO86723.1 hypothetical protein GCM10011584_09740 [Nocardioides phosphati]